MVCKDALVERVPQPANKYAQESNIILCWQQLDSTVQSENLNRTMLNFIGAGAGVSEPGLNRWPDKNKFAPKIWRRT